MRPPRRDSAVRVAIADDHPQLRAALPDLLDAAEGIEVVAVVATGAQALAAVRRLQPDVAILGINMPDDGLKAAHRLAHTAVKVLLLTAHDGPATREAAAAVGAHQLILKGDGTDLVQAVLTTVKHDTSSGPPAAPSGR